MNLQSKMKFLRKNILLMLSKLKFYQKMKRYKRMRKSKILNKSWEQSRIPLRWQSKNGKKIKLSISRNKNSLIFSLKKKESRTKNKDRTMTRLLEICKAEKENQSLVKKKLPRELTNWKIYNLKNIKSLKWNMKQSERD